MKTFSKLVLLIFILAACGPLTPPPPESGVTPGVYEYQDFAYDIAWSQDNSMVALTTLTGLYVYDVKTYKQLFAFDMSGGSISVFGKKYLAAVDNKGLYVWGLKDFKRLFTFKNTEDAQFNGLAFSSDDNMLAAGELKKIQILSLPDGKSVADIPNESIASDMKFKDNERLIVASGFLGNVQEWDVNSKKMLRKFEFGRAVSTLRLSQDASLVLVDYGLTGFQLWDVAAGKIRHNYGDIASATGWQRLSGNNKYVVVWGYAFDGQNSGMAVWDLDIHMHLEEFKTPFVNGDGWRCGSLNSDGSVLAAGNNAGYVYFYDPQTGREIGKFYLPYKFKIEKG